MPSTKSFSSSQLAQQAAGFASAATAAKSKPSASGLAQQAAAAKSKSSASRLAQEAAMAAKAKSRAALTAEAVELASTAAKARKTSEREDKRSNKVKRKPPPGISRQRDLFLKDDDRRAFHGQLYAYLNRMTRNAALRGNYDEVKIRAAMDALADAFSADGVEDVELVHGSKQTDLEDRYGAYPILTARVAALKEKGGQRLGSDYSDARHPLGAALGEIRDLVREASEAASRAALTASEAIIIAAQAKKKARAAIAEKQAWEKRLGELRIWADDAKKAGRKAEDAVTAWDERHKKKLYYYAGKKHRRGKDYVQTEESTAGLMMATQGVHLGAAVTKRQKISVATAEQTTAEDNIESTVGSAKEDACAASELEAATDDSDVESNADSGPPMKAKGSISPSTTAGEPAVAEGTAATKEAERENVACATTVAADGAPRASNKGGSGQPPLISWEERFQHLLHYKAGFGNCVVTGSYSDEKNAPGLGRWVAYMRSSYTAWQKMSPVEQRARSERNQYGVGLTEERIARMEAEGFVWRVPCTPVLSWSERMDQLRAFQEEFGHVAVPRSYPGNLGEWCKTQRLKKKAGDLEASRLRDLEALNFVWSADRGSGKKPWQERYEMMVEFRRRYGHCNAFAVDCGTGTGDHSEKEGEEKDRIRASPDYAPIVLQLRNWSRMMRGEYRKLVQGKKSRIDKTKIKKLEEIKFEWRIRKLRRFGDYDDEETEE